jgi:hypothetical protein
MEPLVKTKASKSDWRQMIKDIDENGDGMISFLEFKSLMIELVVGASDVIQHRLTQLKTSAGLTVPGSDH